MEDATQSLRNVTCPFCGLACDDLALKSNAVGLQVTNNGCAISDAAFRELGTQDSSKASSRVAGKSATLPDAIAAAARILATAKSPLIAGLGTDVAGARAALQLADRIGAVVDHMNMSAKLRNILTVQNSGWITTTLAEIKNRADFVLVLGTSPLTRFPRLLQRAIFPTDTMFLGKDKRRNVFFLGEVETIPIEAAADITRLHCSHQSLSRLIPALRAILNGQRLDQGHFADSDIHTLNGLATAMQAASYGVVVWAAADFDFPHAELTIQTLAEMIKDLNKHIRFAGFPLGGSDGDFSSNGTQTWQTGLPLRSRYGKAGLDFDPHRNGIDELLLAKAVDALLWISSFNAARVPPEVNIPHIVLGTGNMTLSREPDVFIAVGTPGIHHSGHFIRADKVVVMRLNKLIENELPSVATVAEAILRELPVSRS